MLFFFVLSGLLGMVKKSVFGMIFGAELKNSKKYFLILTLSLRTSMHLFGKLLGRPIVRNLNDWELEDYESMLLILASVSLINRDDRLTWNLNKNGLFFVNLLYCFLDGQKQIVQELFLPRLFGNLVLLQGYHSLLGRLQRRRYS